MGDTVQQRKGLLRYRSIGLKLLIGLLLCVGFLVVAIAHLIPVYSFFGQRAFEAHKQELAEAGELLEIGALKPAEVAEDENFAKAEIIRDLFAESSADSLGEEGPFPLLESTKVTAIPGFERPAYSRGNRPVRFIESHPLSYWFPDAADEESTARIVLSYCEEIEKILAQVEVAAQRPGSNFEAEYEKGFAMRHPGGKVVQELGKLLQYRGRAHLILGDADQSVQSLETMLQLSDHIRNESSLIDQLITITIEGMAVSTIKEGIKRQLWTEAHYAKFEELLRDRKTAPGLLRAFRMERAIVLDFLEMLASNTPESRRELRQFLGRSIPNTGKVPRGWVAENAMKYSKIMQERVLSDENGNLRTDTLPTSNNMDEVADEIGGSLTKRLRYIYVSALFPAYSGLNERFLREQTLLDQTRIAIQLEQFRNKHGAFPSTLEPAEIPLAGELLDPFSGQPYRYDLVRDDTYQIYSVGPNELDEGGLLKKRSELGDWVWRLNLPEPFDRESYESRD